MSDQTYDSIVESRIFWSQLLEECQRCIGPAPRQLSFWERWKKPPLPFWALYDPIQRMERQRSALIENGTVVWAHLIQANVSMFKPGIQSAPGDIVFSPYPSIEVNPDYLQEFARALFKIKNDNENEFRDSDFGKHIQNDRDRSYGIDCPLINNYELRISTILFHRQDFPFGFLIFSYFPVLVLPDGAVCVLPKKYWPEILVRHWVRYCDTSLKYKVLSKKLIDVTGYLLSSIAIVMFLGFIIFAAIAIWSSNR
jgi:hypothetical protein